MTETQRKALQAAEDAFRRYADHHAMRGDEAKARANMALAGQMSAALAQVDDQQAKLAEQMLAEIDAWEVYAPGPATTTKHNATQTVAFSISQAKK